MRFKIEPFYTGRELTAILLAGGCRDENGIPFGSVEFVESIIGPKRPDYYPEWTRPAWHRKISTTPIGWPCFVKPADRYKRFTGFVADFPAGGECIHSEVVEFVDEWRHYVAGGVSLCSWWYQGNEATGDDDPHGPPLPFEVPADFCGAVDIGRLSTGEIALVEVQHPYGIGWYGEQSQAKLYADFLAIGFASMLAGF